MIGFITNQEAALEITNAISEAQTSRGHDVSWIIVGIPIISGEHSGKVFIPCDDDVLNCNIRDGLNVRNFPEFDQLVQILGGLDNRINVNEDDLIANEQQ